MSSDLELLTLLSEKSNRKRAYSARALDIYKATVYWRGRQILHGIYTTGALAEALNEVLPASATDDINTFRGHLQVDAQVLWTASPQNGIAPRWGSLYKAIRGLRGFKYEHY